MAKVTNSRSMQALYDRYIGDDPDRVASYETRGGGLLRKLPD